MRLAHQIHVITAVGAMLLMTMGLTIAYGCDEGNVLELALRVYLRPLAECMGRAEDARPLALYSVACIERWRVEHKLSGMIDNLGHLGVICLDLICLSLIDLNLRNLHRR